MAGPTIELPRVPSAETGAIGLDDGAVQLRFVPAPDRRGHARVRRLRGDPGARIPRPGGARRRDRPGAVRDVDGGLVPAPGRPGPDRPARLPARPGDVPADRRRRASLRDAGRDRARSCRSRSRCRTSVGASSPSSVCSPSQWPRFVGGAADVLPASEAVPSGPGDGPQRRGDRDRVRADRAARRPVRRPAPVDDRRAGQRDRAVDRAGPDARPTRDRRPDRPLRRTGDRCRRVRHLLLGRGDADRSSPTATTRPNGVARSTRRMPSTTTRRRGRSWSGSSR